MSECGDIERPPPTSEWPKPCLDTNCICGHRRTWCSYYCHHADVALVTVHEWPCQDGRVCERTKEGRGKCTIGAHCCRDGDARLLGLALTCNLCNRYAYGAQFKKSGAPTDWLPLPPLWPIFFPVPEGYRVYQFHDSRAEEPALNSQQEATEQWLLIEAARKEDARLAKRTADQQKEEKENGGRVSIPLVRKPGIPNVKCIKCGQLKELNPSKLALLEARGLHGVNTGNLAKTGSKKRYPKCTEKLSNSKKCQGVLRVLLAADIFELCD